MIGTRSFPGLVAGLLTGLGVAGAGGGEEELVWANAPMNATSKSTRPRITRRAVAGSVICNSSSPSRASS